MGIADRLRNIRVLEGLLNQCQVAGLAQELGRKIMAQVVDLEIGDSGSFQRRRHGAPETVVSDRPALAQVRVALRLVAPDCFARRFLGFSQ